MSLREVLGPDSLDQIIYVILLWAIILLVSSYILDGPIVRLESVIGTEIIFAWIIWGVNYRLQQMQQERYEKKGR